MKHLSLLLAAAGLAFAQTPDMKSASGYFRATQMTLKNNIVKAAEKMPEESYGFRPSPDIRTFAQLIGHIANASYNYCALGAGEKNPNAGKNIEKDATTKADLVAALKASFDYCEKVYANLSDSQIGDTVKQGTNDRSKFGVLAFNNAHIDEHYGNLVTYMRIRGLVPPSSEK